MLAVKIADRNCSNERMEDNIGLRTVECLRGRLLAERVASKVAKEDAELMGKKLIDLENKLRQEIKSRLKAEKKLKFLLKKLSSLEISYVAEESEPCSSSSENQVVSGGSSLGSSCTQYMEANKSMFRSGSREECSGESTTETITSPSKEENTDSAHVKCIIHLRTSTLHKKIASARHDLPSSKSKDVSTDNSIEVESNQSCVTEDSNNGSPGSKSSVGGTDIDEDGDNLLRDNAADNSLALVLVPRSLQMEIDGEQLKVSGNVGEMLDTLKHAREKIQSSLERRCITKKVTQYA